MGLIIKNITSEDALDRVLMLDARVFSECPHEYMPEYTREKWLERTKTAGDLMLVAEADGEAVAYVFARLEEDGTVAVGPVGADTRFRHLGITRSLMTALEENALMRGVRVLTLGARREAEGFYLKCGYTPYLFVQVSAPYTLDGLRALNTKYPEAWSHDDGESIRLCLATGGIDRALQDAYVAAFPGCSTQTLFQKKLEAY